MYAIRKKAHKNEWKGLSYTLSCAKNYKYIDKAKQKVIRSTKIHTLSCT